MLGKAEGKFPLKLLVSRCNSTNLEKDEKSGMEVDRLLLLRSSVCSEEGRVDDPVRVVRSKESDCEFTTLEMGSISI